MISFFIISLTFALIFLSYSSHFASVTLCRNCNRICCRLAGKRKIKSLQPKNSTSVRVYIFKYKNVVVVVVVCCSPKIVVYLCDAMNFRVRNERKMCYTLKYLRRRRHFTLCVCVLICVVSFIYNPFCLNTIWASLYYFSLICPLKKKFVRRFFR